MRICGQNPRTDADATFQDPHISGLWRESSADLRVWFGSGRNKFVQLLIRSRNSSGWFVRSLAAILNRESKTRYR